LLKAAPEEKRSAFYGVMMDSGREKQDVSMIGDHLPDYLTFWSVIAVRGIIGLKLM
jgi:3-deoxy-D-manno-octulosonate 8-phosphate phosphatase KdsC-like HAD superfamily phosphatase